MYQRDLYLEILGEAGHSPWDARYEILFGDLLNPPIITKEVLFAVIGGLREELHSPELLGNTDNGTDSAKFYSLDSILGFA